MCSRILDNEGIDAEVTGPPFYGDEIVQRNPKIAFQLKSTSEYKFNNKNHLVYSIKAKNYEDLIAPRTIPLILAILILPDSVPTWVSTTEECLKIAKKMYWLNLNNANIVMPEGQKTITLHVPPNNVLTSKSLCHMMHKTAKGEEITNDSK